MDDRTTRLRREIIDWVTCPTIDRPKIVTSHKPKCTAPPRNRCKATAPPAIVNAVDGGESMKCVIHTKAKNAFNVLGQPICEDPWAAGHPDELDYREMEISTIGQRQRPYDIGGLQPAQDNGTYNAIGQRLCDECFKTPPNICVKATVNILGQVVREYDLERLGLQGQKSKVRCEGSKPDYSGSQNACKESFFVT